MSEHEELEASTAAWVLGALEAEEGAALRVHVETCPNCRETAGRLRRAVGLMPLAVEGVPPPAGLRERVLGLAGAASGSGMASVRAPRNKTWTPSVERPPAAARRPAVVYLAAAAVLIALVVGMVAGAWLGRGSGQPPATVVARTTIVGHQDLAGARASVIDLKSDGMALVDFSGLPPPPSGKVYELWLITAAGRAEPIAVFVPDSDGTKVVVVDRSLGAYAQMAITREVGPAGVQTPTEQPQLSGRVA